MPVTLAQAQVNTQADIDYAVIDNLRRYSWLFDQIVFDDTVTPGTGGGSLTYGYTRLTSAAPATFRDINVEYTPSQAVRERFTVDLKPLGGSFELDRVIAALGQASTNETSFQMQQLLNSIRTRFSQEMILGDTAVLAQGFDGLSKALAGTTTEVIPAGASSTNSTYDWTAATLNTAEKAHEALDVLDEFLSLIVPSQTGGGTGAPGDLPAGVRAILGNTKSITRVRSIARRAGMHTAMKDDLGRQIESYGPWTLVDLGDRADGAAPIIPIEARDPDGAGAGVSVSGVTDLYAVTFGLDSFHAASPAGIPLVQTWLPDRDTAGAVKLGEIEMGPVAAVLKNTRSAAVLRNLKVA